MEDLKQAKEVMKEIVGQLSKEEKVELLWEYRNELLFGKRGRF